MLKYSLMNCLANNSLTADLLLLNLPSFELILR